MLNSFLQTTRWLEFQKSLGRKIWRFDNGVIRANIIEHDLPLTKRGYLYIPHGPEIFVDAIRGGIKNEITGFIQYLKDLAKDNSSIFVKIEPLSDTVVELLYNSVKLKRSNKNIQPQKSVILNLSLSEEELLNRMHHKTRYNIRLADKNGITVEPTDELEIFWKLLNKTTKRDRFAAHSKDYYKKLLDFFPIRGEDSTLAGTQEAKHPKSEISIGSIGSEMSTSIITASHEDRPLAAVVIMRYGDTAYYLHGASDYKYRNLMAPYALHWNIIKYLKSQNVHYYDLWGTDARKWPGVTRFKLGWDGDIKEYPGSFDLIVSKFWYSVYNLARKVF